MTHRLEAETETPKKDWLIVCAEHGADCYSVGNFASREEAEQDALRPIHHREGHGGVRVAREADAWTPRLENEPCPDCGYTMRHALLQTCWRCGHDFTAPSAPPVPAPGELEAQSARDIAELNAAALEYEDSADACDTPGLAAFRLRRRTRARALRAIAERVAQLVAAARAGVCGYECAQCSDVFGGRPSASLHEAQTGHVTRLAARASRPPSGADDAR